MRNNESYKTTYPSNFKEVAALADTEDTGTHNIGLTDDVTLINLPAKAAGELTVNLPNVSEARGRTYSIYVIAAGGEAALATVTAGDDAAIAFTQALNAVDERVVMYSDGYAWHPLINVNS
jgi:hypothetical protein